MFESLDWLVLSCKVSIGILGWTNESFLLNHSFFIVTAVYIIHSWKLYVFLEILYNVTFLDYTQSALESSDSLTEYCTRALLGCFEGAFRQTYFSVNPYICYLGRVCPIISDDLCIDLSTIAFSHKHDFCYQTLSSKNIRFIRYHVQRPLYWCNFMWRKRLIEIILRMLINRLVVCCIYLAV